MKASSSSSSNMEQPSMIIEGFICPECQQDLTSAQLLQVHFELFHNKKAKKNIGYPDACSLGAADSTFGLSSVLAKAKTLIAFDEVEQTQNSSAPSSQKTIRYYHQKQPSSGSGDMQTPQQQISPTSPSQLKCVNSAVSYQFVKQCFNSDQQEGMWSSHTADFKKFRDNSIGRYVVQTNKLLITLDKLISIDNDMYNDDAKRETHFKSIVSWIPDNDVQLCPSCAKSFGLLNRKHHCRLCGAIMCNRCSQFISFELAKQLTDPEALVRAHMSPMNGSANQFKLKRSDSVVSMSSYNLKSNDLSEQGKNSSNHHHDLKETYLRMCLNCSAILEKKYNVLKDKLVKSKFTDYYKELYSSIIEAQRLIPIYNKMVESLNLGETTFQLSNAEEMRHKLVGLFKRAESLSSAILNYGISMNKPENGALSNNQLSKDQLKLQRNIRYFVATFLRENSLNIAQVPTQEEYAILVRQRERLANEEAHRNNLMIAQRLNDQQQQQQQNQPTTTPERFVPAKITVSIDNANAWIASSSSHQSGLNFDTDESLPPDADALRIQIQLVESYIEDALKANRKEEADILKKNLNELLICLANLS